MKPFLLFLCLICIVNGMRSQSLVKDINLRADPQNLVLSGEANQKPVTIGNTVFFVADDGISGAELWKTGGTTASTNMIRDIYPGATGGTPRYLTAMNGLLFFTADDGVHGTELWKSDGTPEGTVMVKNIVLSNGYSSPSYLVNNNGTLYFNAGGEPNNTYLPDHELWKSDGTEAGTVLVSNINSTESSEPAALTVFNGEVYFTAVATFGTRQMWKSNGTNAGTVQLTTTIQTGTAPMVVSGPNLYFVAFDPSLGNELFKTDGNTLGMVKDINPLSASGSPDLLTDVNGILFFTAANGNSFSREVWRSDGTDAGTTMLKDIFPGNNASYPPADLVNVNGMLFFTAYEDATGRELWKSNGTTAGTQLVKDLASGNNPFTHTSLTNVYGTLYFSGYSTTGQELWKSDGTAAGTVLVKDIYPSGSSSQPLYLSPLLVGGVPSLVFYAYNQVNGYEMWVSNGTEAGTSLLKNVNPENDDAYNPVYPQFYAYSNGALFFSAISNNEGNELWKTDGTEAGTILLKDIGAGVADGTPQYLTNFNGLIYFSSANSLWRTDGTPAGTIIVKTNLFVKTMITHNGFLYFSGNDGVNGQELWKSDGTGAGTVMVKNIRAGLASGSPEYFNRLGNLLLFVADDGSGKQLWRTDGTAVGTVRIVPATAMTPGNEFAVAGGQLFFTGNNATTGTELWRSNGTDAGTYLVKNIAPDNVFNAVNSNPAYLTALGNVLLFQATSSNVQDAPGNELWRSDGTEPGTTMLKDINTTPTGINPGVEGGSFPSEIIVAAGIAYFYAYTPVNGRELWRTDGTEAGTILVTDMAAGIYSSIPDAFKVQDLYHTYKPVSINNKLYYPSGSAATGIELYQADNTGLVLVWEGIAGTRGSMPRSLYAADDELYYFSDDGMHGVELWHYDPAVNSVLPPGSGNAIINLNEKNTAFTSNGELIARISQSGAVPLNHEVLTKVSVDASVQSYNGQPYVQRHYDIEPSWNAVNATGNVSLYFTQQDFDNFNAANGTAADLPASPLDVVGKAALRIIQYHGMGTAPGSYTGATVTIDPADTDITWNAASSYWEVKFDVTGFSGFFISSFGTILPVKLISFIAKANGCATELNWQTASEENSSKYVVEYSINGTNFTAISEITSKNSITGASYHFTHITPQSGSGYYRLKMMDKDNHFAYSTVQKVTINCSKISVSPNPVINELTITGLTGTSEITIYNSAGQFVRRVITSAAIAKVAVSDLAQGMYLVCVIKESTVVISESILKR